MIFDGLWWKMTFYGRQPSMVDDLWWNTTCDDREPSMEDDFHIEILRFCSAIYCHCGHFLKVFRTLWIQKDWVALRQIPLICLLLLLLFQFCLHSCKQSCIYRWSYKIAWCQMTLYFIPNALQTQRTLKEKKGTNGNTETRKHGNTEERTHWVTTSLLELLIAAKN